METSITPQFSKSDFIGFWGDGYYGPSYGDGPTFPGVDGPTIRQAIINTCITPYLNPEHTALEIGPGGGFWTQFHLGKFKQSILMDVIPLSNNLLQICGASDNSFDQSKLRYIELDNCDYSCPIEDETIDYAFCFGVFCHLPNYGVRKYLDNLIKRMKPGANAFLMFACWERHPELATIALDERVRYLNSIHGIGWSYQDPWVVKQMLTGAGFNIVNPDIFPENRDQVVHVTR